MTKNKITAVLGPTNTENPSSYRDYVVFRKWMIGFLKLLARIYTTKLSKK